MSSLKAAVMSIAMGAGLALPLTTSAQEQAGPWLVRLRAVELNPANRDSTGLDLSINSKLIPEFDVTYFFTPQWAAELVLTVPQKQTIRSGGTDIGTLKHLPPTLTAQYHFADIGSWKPYLGAGLNYTRFSAVSFTPAVTSALQPSLKKSSVGLALQAGVDYEVARNTYINFDVKKVQIRTDVLSAGTRVGRFKVDPWLIGVGVGWRF